MRAFPMFIKTSGRRVVVVGGGEQAAQKIRLLSKTDARLVACAPSLNDELSGKLADGGIDHHSGQVTSADFIGAAMVFIATGCPAADVLYHVIAKDAGALVNVVDNPALCDITTPSIVDRDPVVVAIGTEGTAPVLSRLIKTRIEGMLIANLGRLAAFAGAMRPDVDRAFAGKQRAFWAWVFRKSPMALFAKGHDDQAEAAIAEAIQTGDLPDAVSLHPINVISTDLQAHDLLTLRAVACLQEADVIFHEAEVDTAILELPRRDAERIEVVGPDASSRSSVEEALARQIQGEKVAVLAAPQSKLIDDFIDQDNAPVAHHLQGQAR